MVLALLVAAFAAAGRGRIVPTVQDRDTAKPQPAADLPMPELVPAFQPVLAVAQDDLGEFPKKARPGTDRWYRQQARSLIAEDPAAFERTARGRLQSQTAPLVEKAGILKAAVENGTDVADRLFSEVADTSDPALRKIAFGFLLNDAKAVGASPAAWKRLWNFIEIARFLAPQLRRDGAFVLYATAPESCLDMAVGTARCDTDGGFIREARRGLAANPAAALSGDIAMSPETEGDAVEFADMD